MVRSTFKICKYYFMLGNIISLVNFIEKYTCQPKKELQFQYYNSIKGAIFVHVTYRHALDSIEENMNIVKEYHFYMSDNRSHSSEYVQYCFNKFLSSCKKKYIATV